MRRWTWTALAILAASATLQGCSSSNDPAQTCNIPPESVCNPSPPDGEAGVIRGSLLSWECGESQCEVEVTYDIYLSAGRQLELIGSTTDKSFEPPILPWGTSIEWRVDARDSEGLTEGPVWSFETGAPWYDSLEWTALAEFEAGSHRGAALEWADGALYSLRGSANPSDELDRSFWRYDPGTDSWTRLADAIFDPLWGACLAWTGGDKIYAPQGNGTQEFYEYSISGNGWSQLAEIPEWGVRRGGRILDWPGSGDYLYLVKPIEEDGDENAPFFRYSISTDEWTELNSMPGNLWNGNSLCWDGANGFFATNRNRQFLHYDIASDQWSEAGAFPGANIELGGYLCYDEQGFVWASEGDGSDLIWIYDIAAQDWISGPTAPEAAKWGTTIISDGESVFAFFGDGSTGFWRLGP